MREASSSVSIIKNGPDINWVASPMPAGPKRHATFLISLNLYIPRDGKNKFYAQEFVKFATNYEMQAVQVSERASVNPYIGFDYSTSGLDERLVPAFNFDSSDIEFISVPVQNAYDTISVKLGEMLPVIFAKENLLDNPTGIWAELEAMAKVVDDIYKEYDEYAK